MFNVCAPPIESPAIAAVRPVGQHAIVRLDVRHEVRQEIPREVVGGEAAVGGRRRTAAAPRPPAWRRVRVPGGHHHDHRLRLLRGDQVVEDEARAADRRPGLVGVAGAVQQVEHRILLRARLVARRRVDVHAPELAERRRIVGHGRDRAVRHLLRVEDVRAGT